MLTHFPPADTYSSQANVEEICKSVSNNKVNPLKCHHDDFAAFTCRVCKGADSTQLPKLECVPVKKNTAAAVRKLLRRDRPGGLLSPAFHAGHIGRIGSLFRT